MPGALLLSYGANEAHGAYGAYGTYGAYEAYGQRKAPLGWWRGAFADDGSYYSATGVSPSS